MLKHAAPSAPAVSSPRYLTVADWRKHFAWPPDGGLRHIIFHAETNGFAPAIKRVGRRVLIDSAKFWEIVASQEGAKHG